MRGEPRSLPPWADTNRMRGRQAMRLLVEPDHAYAVVVEHLLDRLGPSRRAGAPLELDRALHGLELEARRVHVVLNLLDVLVHPPPERRLGRPVQVVALHLDDKP